jgi:serine/threonine protein phosphatase PrpC
MQAGHYATTDTKVAAILCTVGVRLRQQDPISRVVQKGRETVHYWMDCDGAGGISTGKIVEAILDGQEACEALREQLPDLPGARAALYNREILLDVIFKKTRRLVMVNLPGGGVMLADEKLSPETKRQVAQMVM